jgi:hypothetical protein
VSAEESMVGGTTLRMRRVGIRVRGKVKKNGNGEESSE